MDVGTINRQLENVPLPILLQKLGNAIGDAQLALDRHGIELLKKLADREENGVTLPGTTTSRSMLELGFSPTFYHFSNATLDVQVTFTMMEGTEISVGGSVGVSYFCFSATVSASYTSRYSFSGQATSGIKASITAVPPPALLTEIIQKARTQSP